MKFRLVVKDKKGSICEPFNSIMNLLLDAEEKRLGGGVGVRDQLIAAAMGWA